MHKIAIPGYFIERALKRRGRLNPFDGIEPAKTALVVVDLQNGFMAPGQPVEIAEARDIVPNVSRLAGATRAAGGTVVWIQNTVTPESDASWSNRRGNFADAEWSARARQAFTPGDFGHALYPTLEVPRATSPCARPGSARLSRAPPTSTRYCARAASIR